MLKHKNMQSFAETRG